jgi:hypothetical protein
MAAGHELTAETCKKALSGTRYEVLAFESTP